jgi:hypothetical protein
MSLAATAASVETFSPLDNVDQDNAVTVHKEIFFMSILAIILNKGGPVEQCVS